MKITTLKKQKITKLNANLVKNQSFFSKEYASFCKLKQGLNRTQIKSIDVLKKLKNIEQEGLHSPIQVFYNPSDKKFYIIDGQHRFEALVLLDLPIWFMLMEADNMVDACRQLRNGNNEIKKWMINDFISSYAVEGKKPYIEYQKQRDVYGSVVNDNELRLILMGADCSKGNTKFNKGEFVVNNLNNALPILDFVKEMYHVHKIDSIKNRYVQQALFKVYADSKFNINTMKSALLTNRSKVVVKELINLKTNAALDKLIVLHNSFVNNKKDRIDSLKYTTGITKKKK